MIETSVNQFMSYQKLCDVRTLDPNIWQGNMNYASIYSGVQGSSIQMPCTVRVINDTILGVNEYAIRYEVDCVVCSRTYSGSHKSSTIGTYTVISYLKNKGNFFGCWFICYDCDQNNKNNTRIFYPILGDCNCKKMKAKVSKEHNAYGGPCICKDCHEKCFISVLYTNLEGTKRDAKNHNIGNSTSSEGSYNFCKYMPKVCEVCSQEQPQGSFKEYHVKDRWQPLTLWICGVCFDQIHSKPQKLPLGSRIKVWHIMIGISGVAS